MNSHLRPPSFGGAIAAAPAMPELTGDAEFVGRHTSLRVTSALAPSSATQTSNTPTILLVDDDSELLRAIAATLRLNGFEVLACDCPQAAELAFRQAPHVDLLVTDLQMPEISGTTLAERLLTLQPSLPVMIISGAILTRGERESTDGRGWCSLAKPFDVMQLLTVIYGMLASAKDKAVEASLHALACFPESALPQPNGPRDTGPEPAAGTQPEKYGARKARAGKVLLIGNEAALQQTRQLLLESAGFTTKTVGGRAALDCLDLDSFNVALLCRSVPPGDAVQIARTLHARNPNIAILRFASLGESSSGQFDTAVTNVSSPTFLIAEVERLASHPH